MFCAWEAEVVQLTITSRFIHFGVRDPALFLMRKYLQEGHRLDLMVLERKVAFTMGTVRSDSECQSENQEWMWNKRLHFEQWRQER